MHVLLDSTRLQCMMAPTLPQVLITATKINALDALFAASIDP